MNTYAPVGNCRISIYFFWLQYLTSNTVADDKDEHAHMREEDVRENFPDWLALLHVELILFTHCLSYL